jgi:hypothetical protein
MFLAVGGDEAARAARKSHALELPRSLSAAVGAVRDAVAST